MPGLVVTVYAGTTFSLDDGSQPKPFPLVAIQVPVDRLPDQIATSGKVLPFIVAFQPANAVSSQPVSVNFPNSLNISPGTAATFVTLDPTRGFMVPYGTGTVSKDGTKIIADADPAHPGHCYGLVHFDWHGPSLPPPPAVNPGPDGGGGAPPENPPAQSPPTSGGDSPSCGVDTPTPPQCDGGDPVDLSSGLLTYTSTDLVIRGGRGSIAVVRTFRSLSSNPGPFGLGTGSSYSWALNTFAYIQGQGVIYLGTPNGSQFPLNLQQDGTFTNTAAPFLRGASLTVTSGAYLLRWGNGTIYQFQTSALGGREAFLTAITDLNQNTISLTLNPSQPLQITQITDPVGRSITLSYDGANRVVSASDTIGRSVSYTYNAQGLLSTFTDPGGGVTKYTYDPQNNLATVTDPNNNLVQQNFYDPDNGGRVTSQIEANGGTFSYSYTLEGLCAVVGGGQNSCAPTLPVVQTILTDPLGNKTTYRFDPTGLLLSVVDATGQTRTLQRDPTHNNLVTAYTGGGACSVCGNPAIGDVHYTFDGAGNVSTRTDALGNVTSYTYDLRFNKITLLIDPLGHASTFAYDPSGNLITTTDANNNTTSYTYSFGEVTQINDALGNKTALSYDPFGNLSSISDPLGNTTNFVYDAVSRRVQVIDALGRKTTTAYDALNRVTSTTDAQNNTTQLAYDKNNNLLSLTDANNHKTSFSYDAMNNILTRTDPLNHTDTRTYDKNRNLIKFVDRRGQASRFGYDSLNRIVTESYDDGSSVSRAYDANARATNTADSLSGSFDFTYDADGRLLTSANRFGTLQYQYDTASHLTSRQVVGQSAVQYVFDSVGNLLSAAMPQASASFTYDPDNRLSKITRLNGVASTYGYDAASHLLSITHSGGAGVNIPLTYTYDQVGNRSVESTAVGEALTTASAASTFNQDNQLTTSNGPSGATSYSYDANGNLTSAVTPNGTTTYTWDTRNRLKTISQPNGQSTSFLYGPGRNLLRQTDSGPTLNRTQAFILDQLTNPAFISISTGDSLSVLNGLGIDQDLAVIHAGGAVEYGLKDAINSTVGTVDQTGAPKGRFVYEPFGQTTANGTEYPFQFTGRTPAASNLFYYRARFYSAATGRFLSQDPFGFVGGSNLYRYARGAPIIFNDPTGGYWEAPILGGAIIAAYLLQNSYLYQQQIMYVIEFLLNYLSPSGSPSETPVGMLGSACSYGPPWFPYAATAPPPDYFNPGTPILTTPLAASQVDQLFGGPVLSGGNNTVLGRPR